MTKMVRFLFLALGILSLAAEPSFPAPGILRIGPQWRAPEAGSQVAILCYHDVSEDPAAPYYTVSADYLRAQIRASKAAGWSFMSVSELVSHRDRFRELPARVMVLTFDDGYRSFHERVMPILREEQVKATLAVITSFVDRPPPDVPPLMTWEQIREADRSEWVEVVSHSHDLHHYITGNPYRDTGSAVGTRRYLADLARYEDRDEYRRRIRDDLQRSRQVLSQKLGREVSILAWPFGAYNDMALGLASEAGFTTTLALGGGPVRPPALHRGCLPRVMVTRDMDPRRAHLDWIAPPARAVRAAQVDLDDLYDEDGARFRANVDRMVARVRRSGATHVFLQACPDPEGDGRLRQTYFMNHQVPVLADVWSMVATRLSHAGIKVWIRSPSMNLSWVWAAHPEWRIPHREGRRDDRPWYYRVSPNLPQVHRAAIDFYTDLAVYLPIEGVLFDDDAYMLPGESLAGSLNSHPATKAEAIHGLLEDIRAAVLAWRPYCKFARNVYAPVVERRGVHRGFAQDYEQCLRDFDLTVVMAYARMEGHERDAARWTAALARKAVRRWRPAPGRRSDPAPVMLKLQAYDWATEEWVPARELQTLAWEAKRAGVTHLGVYPVAPEDGEIPDRLMEALPPDRHLAEEATTRR